MLHIKKLYIFIIKTFLPLFLAAFSVCLFILLMQFLWKYVDDMVGKGVSFFVLGEIFFYAALFSVPMALPLAILLASLMTFGNLGEKFELLAMKASGISLLQILKPVIVLICIASIGAFFFQNNTLPPAQSKLWTLISSVKLKSPELDIPQKTFYKEISGYNVYIDHKDKETGMMYGMMIYNFVDGFDNAKVILADSGKLEASTDKQYLVLSIYSGESFENLKKQSYRIKNEKIPYRREKFSLKEMLIAFDANFKMADESVMSNRDFTKDLSKLRVFIDSVTIVADSTDRLIAKSLVDQTYSQVLKTNVSLSAPSKPIVSSDTLSVVDVDSYFDRKDLNRQQQIISIAKSRIESIKGEYLYSNLAQKERVMLLIGHEIEFHRKFTLSFACLVFLFIGAPLGAIIRKGGLGMPAVISVFLFLFYYSIDIFSVKLARQSVLPVWLGTWSSSFILSALGVFFTYKAVNDSVMLNADAWMEFFKRLMGKKEIRNYQRKEVIMDTPDYEENLNAITDLTASCNQYLALHGKIISYISYWKNSRENAFIEAISEKMELIIEDLLNSEENYIIGKLMDYPVINHKRLFFLENSVVRTCCCWFFPVGLIFYCWDMYRGKGVKHDIEVIRKVNDELFIEIEKKLCSN